MLRRLYSAAAALVTSTALISSPVLAQEKYEVTNSYAHNGEESVHFAYNTALPVRMIAYIYEPPTNIRRTPAGEVIAVARTPVCVPIHTWVGEWNLISYPHLGWVHDSQLLFGYCP